MDRRKQGLRLKQIVTEVTGQIVSVRSGRGTARAWWYITLRSVSQDQREKIEWQAMQEGLLGHYFPDSGPGDDWTPCVLFLSHNGATL